MAKSAQPNARLATAITQLVDIMAALRHPQTGCAWDIEQNFETIAPYTIEEAYEVAEAIARNDMAELRDELGDLLFQVVFHSQMASENGAFQIADVVEAIIDKMIRRHPHVFGEHEQRSAHEQTVAWETMKASERKKKVNEDTAASALDGVAHALPALMRAEKLQKRAARTGFDWHRPEEILDKMQEEIREVMDAVDGGNAAEIEEEIGDLLFVAANLSRRLSVDPEVALRRANAKFERRFRAMEAAAEKQGKDFGALSLEAQEALWQLVKKSEKGAADAE